MRRLRAVVGAGALALAAGAVYVPLGAGGASAQRSHASSESGASFAGLSPRQILRAALGAASAAQSARVVSISRTSSKSGVFSNDSGPQSGRQTIQVGPAVTNILVTSDRTAYVEGNAQGLVQSLGVPSSLAVQLGDTWISMKPGNPGYETIEVGVTLPSVMQEVSPQTSLAKTKPLTIDGKRVVGVSGKQTVEGQKGVSTLYVAINGDHLPVASRGRSGNQYNSATFSNWGEPVQVAAPPNSVPITSILQGGNSPGGGVVTAAYVG